MTARIVWDGDDPIDLTPEDVEALAREGIAFPTTARVYPCCDDPTCGLCHGSGVFDPAANPQTCVRCGVKGASTAGGFGLLCDDCVPVVLPPDDDLPF